MQQFIKNQIPTLEFLKEFCEENIEKIIDFSLQNIPNIIIRYIDPYGYFGYASLGNFFFVKDSLYIFTYGDKYQDFLDEEIFSLYIRFPDIYPICVVFAGVFTSFLDKNGQQIFTGDVIQVRQSGGYISAGISEQNNEFCLIFNTHFLPISQCKEHNEIHIAGSLFYNLSEKTKEVDIRDLCNQHAQQHIDKELIEKSPNCNLPHFY